MGTSIYAKYCPEHNFGGRKVLNIGCGFAQYKYPNVINVDAYNSCDPDIVWDLNKTPYPFLDNSFDLILANHILEHLPNWWGAFNECARVLREGGILELWVPGAGSDSIFGYRDHVNEINHCSFFGVIGTYRGRTNAWAIKNIRNHCNRLKIINKVTNLENKIWLKYAPNFLKNLASVHLRNIVLEDGYIFRKVTHTEYEKERREFNERNSPKGNKTVQML